MEKVLVSRPAEPLPPGGPRHVRGQLAANNLSAFWTTAWRHHSSCALPGIPLDILNQEGEKKPSGEAFGNLLHRVFFFPCASCWIKDAVSEPHSAHAFLGVNVYSTTRLTSSCIEQDDGLLHSFASCYFVFFIYQEEITSNSWWHVAVIYKSIIAGLSCISPVAVKLFKWCATDLKFDRGIWAGV